MRWSMRCGPGGPALPRSMCSTRSRCATPMTRCSTWITWSRHRMSAMFRAMSTSCSLPTFSIKLFPMLPVRRPMSSIRMRWVTDGNNCKEKDRPRTAGLSQLKRRASEVLVGGVGRTIDGILGCFLGVAQRLLALALHLLDSTFALQAIGADGFADALLGLAHSLIGRTL